jgi:hypothetical protein
MERTLFALAFLAAIGCRIVGGIFYGFSSFVMQALARIAPEQGVAAMNSINVSAVFAGLRYSARPQLSDFFELGIAGTQLDDPQTIVAIPDRTKPKLTK